MTIFSCDIPVVLDTIRWCIVVESKLNYQLYFDSTTCNILLTLWQSFTSTTKGTQFAHRPYWRILLLSALKMCTVQCRTVHYLLVENVWDQTVVITTTFFRLTNRNISVKSITTIVIQIKHNLLRRQKTGCVTKNN